MTLSKVKRKRDFNIEELLSKILEMHLVVQQSLRILRRQICEAELCEEIRKFSKCEFVLVAHDNFASGKKLSPRLRGTPRILKAINDYVSKVENLRKEGLQDVHGTQLRFYSDCSFGLEVVMLHLSPQGMEGQCNGFCA